MFLHTTAFQHDTMLTHAIRILLFLFHPSPPPPSILLIIPTIFFLSIYVCMRSPLVYGVFIEGKLMYLNPLHLLFASLFIMARRITRWT